MTIINNLKIQTKFLISFALILIITVIIGINGLNTANNLENNLSNFYDDRFLTNMILGKIQVNQEKASLLMNRILWESEVMNDKSIIYTSEEDLLKIVEENELLLKEYEATSLSQDEKELLENMKSILFDYRIQRDQVIEYARSGNYNLAIQINNEKAAPLRQETTNIIAQIKEYNADIALKQKVFAHEEYIHTKVNANILLAITLLIGILMSFVLSRNIAGPIKILVGYAKVMAEGDFTIKVTKSLHNRKDEMGIMASAFSEMINNTRVMLKEVAISVEETSSSSEELSATVEEVSAQVDNINSSVHQIASGMEEISASIEEIAATNLEIRNNATNMVDEAQESEVKVDKITQMAENMKASARHSRENAKNIYALKEKNIKQAIEEVAVVEEIEKMASIISEIAEQSNLLALNASIEAARAGEQGRGFSVVANEVGKLAEHSSSTVRDINIVIKQVKVAVSKLISNADEILKFIEEKVSPDYDMLEKTGEQYVEDASFVKNIIKHFSDSATHIANSINEIGISIDGVAAAVEQTTASSLEISNSSEQEIRALEEVSNTAQAQAELAMGLTDMVSKFKL